MSIEGLKSYDKVISQMSKEELAELDTLITSMTASIESELTAAGHITTNN